MRISLPYLVLASTAGVYSHKFDYVIAGAGTAGLVLAGRLSEDPSVNVVVIEPGPDVRNDPVVQGLFFSFSNFNASINWVYPTIPQPQLNNRTLSYRAGKAIGGTSQVNGWVYIRGDKAQYDAWEELGNTGWNWDSIFSNAKKGEHFVPPTSAQVAVGASYDPAAHGFAGPVHVSFPFDITNSSFAAKASKTYASLGLHPIKEVNGGSTHGSVLAPLTVDRDTGSRSSSATAYYQPVNFRKNLNIIQGTVKRIVWADSYGKDAVAEAVEYVDPSGKLVQIGVKKDVILSASAFRNPLILEASGVGNPTLLKKLGIKTKVDLPGVGENMFDHTAMGTSYDTNTNITGRTVLAALPTARDVLGNNTAAVAASSLAKLDAYAKQASDAIGGAISTKAFRKRFQVQHDLIFKKNVTVAELFPTNAGTSIIPQFWITLPFSWGSVHLGSVDKINEPVIDSGLLKFDVDYQMLTAVTRFSRKAYHSAPLTDLVGPETVPGDAVLPLDASDADYAAYLKQNCELSLPLNKKNIADQPTTAANAIHVVGTCAMLPQELGGVVDSRVKVHGTKNVRVVDASIVPMQITGHTMAPVYALSERAAAIIKADWS